MKRWFSDPLFRRMVLLAFVVGALSGADAAFHSEAYPAQQGVDVAIGILIGASSMRLWTSKEKP